MVTAVDTSVLLDVLLNDPQHAPASIAALHRAAAEGSLAICDVALAEVVPVLKTEDLPQFLADWNFRFSPPHRRSPSSRVKRFACIWTGAASAGGWCRIF